MRQILFFNGSPRPEGGTAQMLSQIAAGAKQAGARTRFFLLNAPGIRGCQGCYHCRTHEGCATDDALQPMYSALLDADAVVVGMPVYFGAINGQSKIWLDRMFPMTAGFSFTPRYPGKKFFLACTQAAIDPAAHLAAWDFLAEKLTGFGWEEAGRLLCSDTDQPGFRIPEALAAEAFAAGAALAR